ncbi:MAG: hypothetical protein GY701_25660 [Sulfitobacter sp.]|nr:hypothetical protein [Sulfitobacter sp.]
MLLMKFGWRESLRDGRVETFFASYRSSRLPGLDSWIESQDAARVAFARANAAIFCAI